MIKFHTNYKMLKIAELTDKKYLISTPDDFLDLIGNLGSQDCGMLILCEENLHPDFFDLKTRLAGEILQKCSNYQFRLAIIGNFSKYSSKSLRDFIYESNKGRLVTFTNNLDSALNWFNQ